MINYAFINELVKVAKVTSELLPSQERVLQRILEPNQPGLVVAHGLGRGKTLASIAAQEALGVPADVVVPASLRENYQKEVDKHTDGRGPARNIFSQQAVSRGTERLSNPVLILDEAHKAREVGSKLKNYLKDSEAEKRLLLTASPFYNHPADLSALVNLAANQKILPETRGDFSKEYISKTKIGPGFFGWIRGVKPGVREDLNPRRAKELAGHYGKYVDYEPGSSEGFPSVSEEDVEVLMSKQQLKTYDALLGRAPAWVRYKVKKGLPPSKAESKQLNAFMGAVRQVSNTTSAYDTKNPAQDPKIQTAFNNLKEEIKNNPKTRAVVYSNYLDSGLNPYAKRLEEEKIPYGLFTGQQTRKEKDQIIKDYNTGKLRALLLSSAGGEGLDLKGTRLMQVLDPHWNNEKLKQVKGRGIRYMSHDHLPEDQRNVRIENYLATRPRSGLLEKMRLSSPGGSVDQYLQTMSKEKEKLIKDFRDLLEKNRENYA